MAVTLSVQEHTENDEAGAYAVSRVILAKDTVAITADDVRAALPVLGASIAVGTATAYLRRRTLTKRRGGGGRVWMAQLDYATQVIEANYTLTASHVDNELVDIWRTGATPPADLSVPTTIDIGGAKVDTAGDPITQLVPRIQYRVKNKVASVSLSTIASIAGKRNSATFLGNAAGYLLFRGADIEEQAPGLLEVVYDFVADAWAFLRQKPKLDADRQPVLTAPDGNGVAKAAHVFWVQPLPATAAFSGLGITL